ncbi:MAG: GGDEF domain-containing protein [Sulfuricurvum sp.]
MHKNDIKALVEQLYDNLIEHIDSNESYSKEQLLEHIHRASEAIIAMDLKSVGSIEETKQAYKDSYKDIAKRSLDSYSFTSEKFEEISKMHQATIEECNSPHIDLSSLSQKFSEIQSHMSDEISRANNIITELTRKVAILEQTSNIDPLTKVLNRRSLSTHLGTIFSNETFRSNLHMIMLDIDDFKQINDNYGHITGDKILIFVASLLKKTLRDSDKIFRYGGEEFIIILNRNEDEEARLVADRILKLIRNNRLIYLGETINITASIGLTRLLKSDKTQEDLLQRADKALYKSKSDGKNRLSEVYE